MKIHIITFYLLLLILRSGYGGIELYMADPEVRIAQKIYCQLVNVSSSDKLLVILDDQTIFLKEGNLRPEEVVVVDHRNQVAGRHTLTVSILTADDETKASTSKTWTTLHNGIPTVGIDENNAVRVNGELFFPVSAEVGKNLIINWVQNKYLNTSADMTYINGRYGYSTDYTLEDYRDFLDLLAGLGVRNIGPTYRWFGMGKTTGQGNDLNVMADYVKAFKDHPAVLMWQWADEPDRGGDPALGGDAAYPTEIRSWHDVVHQYDTNHPHAVNLTAYAWARDGAWYIDHCGDYSFLYGADWHQGEKKLVGDVIGCDFYPIEFATKVPEKFGDLVVNFESMSKAMDRIREWTYNLCPIFSWNEPCDLNPDLDGDGFADGHEYSPYRWTPPPTPAELWAEYWIKIIHGVKGIKLHPYFDPAGTAIPPYNHETMAKFVTWVEALTHAILGPDYTGEVRIEELFDGRIDILAKTCNDTIYLVAGNLKYEKARARIYVDVLASNQDIKVYGEDRILVSQDGYFEDDFDSLAVHIYKFFPQPNTAITIPESDDFTIDQLFQNHPNPFNTRTKFSYTLSCDSHVELMIYDLQGRQVDKLFNGFQSAGQYTVIWAADKLPSGPYFCTLVTDNVRITKRLLLIQ